jgi:hypothetical protein
MKNWVNSTSLKLKTQFFCTLTLFYAQFPVEAHHGTPVGEGGLYLVERHKEQEKLPKPVNIRASYAKEKHYQKEHT